LEGSVDIAELVAAVENCDCVSGSLVLEWMIVPSSLVLVDNLILSPSTIFELGQWGQILCAVITTRCSGRVTVSSLSMILVRVHSCYGKFSSQFSGLSGHELL
jgi:hypothetical protein